MMNAQAAYAEPPPPPVLEIETNLSERQMEMIEHEAQILWVGAGTKTGKTIGALGWIGDGVLAGDPCAWIGPWSDKTRKAYTILKGILEYPRRIGYVKTNDSTMSITCPATGGVFYPYTGDNPEGIFGDACKRVVIDEASRQSSKSFVASTTLIAPFKNEGKIKVMFNLEHGRKNWAIANLLRVKAMTPSERRRNGEGYMTFPTLDQSFVTPEYVERMKHLMPRAMYEALFLGIIPDEDTALLRNLEKIFSGPQTQDAPIRGHSYVMGTDLARKTDFTVATVIDVTYKKIVDAIRFNEISWNLQYKKIAALYKTWNCTVNWVDATGVGDPAVEELEKLGMRVEPFVISGRTRKELLDELVIACDGPIYTASADERFKYHRLEFDAFGYEFDEESGKVTYGAAEHEHDDTVFSSALAVHAAESGNYAAPRFAEKPKPDPRHEDDDKSPSRLTPAQRKYGAY